MHDYVAKEVNTGVDYSFVLYEGFVNQSQGVSENWLLHHDILNPIFAEFSCVGLEPLVLDSAVKELEECCVHLTVHEHFLKVLDSLSLDLRSGDYVCQSTHRSG